MRTLHTLDLEDARRAIATIREALLGSARTAVIAVADAGGEPIALERLDGAPATSVAIAMNKAWTAATQGTATGAIGARLRSADEAFDIAYYGDRRACGWAGGLPVRDARGRVVGSVAVSGLPEHEDEALAELGRDAIERSLER